MEDSRFSRLLDYFPLIAYGGFWLQGALISSIFTGEPKLMALGLVTLPAIVAMLLAVARIRKRHRERVD